MAIKGGFLRLLLILTYFTAFCCAAIITGVFAWFTFLQTSSEKNLASLIIGALAMLYTSIQTLFVCCTAGITFFAIISIILDVVFMGGMMAVAIINRSAVDGECEGRGGGREAYYRYGGGGGGGRGRGDDEDVGCEVYKTAFAVAILGIFMFLAAAITQMLVRRRRRERRAPVTKV
ncbi:uncharacterized protein RCC_00290 [Ramularia collo-cygni]|uniref:MARVEL domain-containing protein n=1 Tax=Ramularia collo-cygni TaxID=112498 RepID=A0A2D3V256_9PEZI|nr:uncharacterized protein RCC_00290 [Ramularia collo-cygni]CZT14313.1 uncharacterized protein RCC_00290 [Ramularia collo-cygni]